MAQTFWVGGLWLLHLVMLPALERIGLAPMLVGEIANTLSPLLVLLAVVGLLVQTLILLQVERFSALWRDSRGQLLVVSLLVALGYGALQRWLPDALRLQLFCFLVLALCGALLVLQPVPDGEAARARKARH
ncbi:putative copper export protein [Pseudomonas sp. TE3786]